MVARTPALASARAGTLNDISDELTAELESRGINPGTIKLHNGTAMANSRMRAVAARQDSIHALPPLLEDSAESAAQFRITGILGEGGMGVVRLARQGALDRDVAVKSLRADVEVDEAAGVLMREARVTGALEHPNVVPIYALGRDEGDRPLLVMKRIEGRSWAHVLADADDAERLGDAYLHLHLGILRQVALAVAFAHEKGVLHRDIKPDNVMIGSFGEVYLVDWGIAVNLREDGVRGLPLAREVCDIEGTPPYLAPEMAVGSGADIDERSDVYLLGATLHEIVTGEPPHHANTIMAMLTKAFTSEPASYPPEVPQALVAVCHGAMARFSADRYPSARAFVSAIDHYLEHRASLRLADEAAGRLARLFELCDAGAAAAERGDGESAHAQAILAQTMFAEVRFAFQQALRSWPDNDGARQGLQRALERMIRFELVREAPDAAQGYLRELPQPNAELAREVQAAVDEKRDAAARLTRLERDRDLSIGERERRRLTLALGSLWGFASLAIRLCAVLGIVSDMRPYAAGLEVAVAVGILLGRLVLPALGVTEANRSLMKLTAAGFLGLGAIALIGMRFGLDIAAITAMGCAAAGILWTGLAITVDSNWYVMTASVVVSLLGGLAYPLYAYEIFGVCGFFGAILASRRWVQDKRVK